MGFARWAFLFGFILGLGFLTIITSGTYYVFLVASYFYSVPLASVAIVTLFGLGRAFPMLIAAVCVRRRAYYDADTVLDCVASINRLRASLVYVTTMTNALLLGSVGHDLIASMLDPSSTAVAERF